MAIIDNTKRVKVEDRKGREHSLLLLHHEGAGDYWIVEREFSGERIGRVFKSSYDYSPPTHSGSRIVRYHHAVKSWKSEVGFYPDSHTGIHHRTRKAALVELLTEAAERGALLKKLKRLNRKAREPIRPFRLNRGKNAVGSGWIGRLTVEGNRIVIFDPERPAEEREQRVLVREIESDVRPCLELFDAEKKEFQAVANLLWEMED